MAKLLDVSERTLKRDLDAVENISRFNDVWFELKISLLSFGVNRERSELFLSLKFVYRVGFSP